MFLLKKWHYYLLNVVLFALILMSIGGCKRHPNEQNSNIPTYEGLDYREDYDQANPRQICDYFSVNLLHNPQHAYPLCKYDNDCSLEQFIQMRNMMLPAAKDIVSVEFIKAEHGFTEMSSGLQSSECIYKVKSKDDFFQPEMILQIDVAEEENRYHILRFAVTSE